MTSVQELRSRTFQAAFILACVAAVGAPRAHTQGTNDGTRRVHSIDLFGYSGWDRDDPSTAALRKQLAPRVGAEVKLDNRGEFRRKIQGDVIAATGKPATDVAIICCTEGGELSVFVGVQGQDAVPLEQVATPTGPDTLPPEAFELFTAEQKALQAAVEHGSAGEDDSRGYALSKEPAARAIQEQMHVFAATHADVMMRVLRRSGDVAQRRAAAELLGYADRSPAQVRALQEAMSDDDERVRDNATRALATLAAAGPLPGFRLGPVIGLLYSGIWTDRNKASVLLLQLTAKHDPRVLKELASQALPPLIEGTLWKSKQHAFAFAMVLGRVAGMPDERSSELFNTGKADVIADAGKALEASGRR